MGESLLALLSAVTSVSTECSSLLPLPANLLPPPPSGSANLASFPFADLSEDITPAAVATALSRGQHLKGLLIALRLNDADLIRRCILATPPRDVGHASHSLPGPLVPRVMAQVAEALRESPHVEFLLRWAREIGVAHGETIRAMPRHLTAGPTRALHQAVTQVTECMCSGAGEVVVDWEGDRRGMERSRQG